ncbi:hypothetical protein BWI96_06960 [Siphonobacter sp. SORGH_AS_0500]|uniref:hypothetical protein n=1 Tax=Siphonobacter sp. SORGH_AS_0500 TaxID=1864824 RepID=UPI000CC2FF2A|nr:hypothetical protein [Siphonobacter sp. SORGH_AS_0500]PKK37096.1 hypothetical protein BWI96_06960 [Siphonobacter sp. SORGH_AS_0500]
MLWLPSARVLIDELGLGIEGRDANTRYARFKGILGAAGVAILIDFALNLGKAGADQQAEDPQKL